MIHRFDSELVALFELSVDAFCIAGFDGYLKLVNPAFPRILGYTHDELLARPFIDLVHPDDVESVRAVLAELAQGNDIVGFECRQVCADGSVRWLEWNTRTRPEEGFVYGVGRDVTERHGTDTALSALRRVATLVAEGVQPHDLFAVVAEEIARVIGVPVVHIMRFEVDGTAMECGNFAVEGPVVSVGSRWSFEGTNVLQLVRASGDVARIDDFSELEGELAELIRRNGIRSAIGIPIVVAGRLWGAVVVSSREPLPEGTETRLADFTELLATAIANAESRAALTLLAEEQAALRRVATLVAEGVPPSEVFSALGEEVNRLLDAQASAIARLDADGRVTIVASGGTVVDELFSGSRLEPEPGWILSEALQTGRPARKEDFNEAPKRFHRVVSDWGIRSAVAVPIFVGGALWGATVIGTVREHFADETEQHLEEFTQLVATAIANAQSRDALGRLADEQAALRRVAVLVAQGARPADIFSAVCEEVGRLVGTDAVTIGRFETEEPALIVVAFGKGVQGIPAGSRWEHDDALASTRVFRTGRSARVDQWDPTSAPEPVAAIVRRLGLVSTVASPIVVEGHLWGALTASSKDEPLPLDAAERLERFCEVVATAIASVESREALGRLADEQAALRRVATLVAQGVRPEEIFAAVSEEVDHLFGLDEATVGRFEPDGSAFVVVGVAKSVEGISIGSRWELDPLFASMEVFRTGHSARVEASDLESVGGPVAAELRRLGLISTVASPIIVEGNLWGAITVVSNAESLPLDTEERLEKFAELAATAIANAEGRSQLAASRARIIAASDEARRRIERDIHDGTQQRLVALGLAVRAAEAGVPTDSAVRPQLSRIATGLGDAVDELQEMSRGIHPANLARGGLRTALRGLARRSPVPVEVDATSDTRLPEPIEVAVYYVASEALANAAKHAHATRIEVCLAPRNGNLLLSIRDDGVGGADPARGSGLTGLTDRVEALGGRIQVRSPPGDGTEITAELPVELKASEDAD